jgi:hypothetical protein
VAVNIQSKYIQIIDSHNFSLCKHSLADTSGRVLFSYLELVCKICIYMCIYRERERFNLFIRNLGLKLIYCLYREYEHIRNWTVNIVLLINLC